ncbi:MAG: hypothetical protein E7344_05910 [Clostridiales bacterium]|nr:hypothetical protein [Clostridiales bacterium]
MQIEKLADKIVLTNVKNFKAKDILECGQIFRFIKNQDGHYTVFSLDKKADIFEYDDRVEIITKSTDYFADFFDLQKDYSVYHKKYGHYDFFDKAYIHGEGIRILNQNLAEMIFSFIISANNNIKRIQLIIDRICNAIGDDMGGYHAFPTIDQMAGVDEQFFKDMGAGYRAGYLVSTAKALQNGFDLESLKNMDRANARKALLSLKGVGPKVADCILLFGLKKTNSFPIDTWTEKVYHVYFESGLKNREAIANFFVNLFGDDAGYVQQYLFYYQRENF